MATLELTAGKPWSKVVRIPDGKNVWTSLDQFEVRAQLRATPQTTSRLIGNMHLDMVVSFDGDDIILTWVMSGQRTRELYSQTWGMNKTGYVTIILSDVGTEDVRTRVVPTLQIIGKDTTTTGSGAS